MKKLTFLTLILISCKAAIPTNQQKLAQPAMNIKAYYEYTNQAENAIIEKNYQKALSFYCQAFEKRESFYRDYLNAWYICRNYNLTDSAMVMTLFKERKRKSKTKQSINDYIKWTIENYPAFDTSFMYSFMKMNTFDVIPNKKTNTILNNKIDSIFELDQFVRISDKKNIRQQDSLNLKAVLNLYQEYETINEQTTSKNSMQRLSTIFLHLSRYENDSWIDLLYKETLKGNFDNRAYAQLLDSYWSNQNKDTNLFLSNFGYPLYDKYAIPVLDKSILAEVNKKRKTIMLCSVKEQQKKQLWNFRHGFDVEFFQFFSYFESYPDMPESAIKQTIERQDAFIKDLNSKYKSLLIFNKHSDNYDIH
jgi:hypothetical protein